MFTKKIISTVEIRDDEAPTKGTINVTRSAPGIARTSSPEQIRDWGNVRPSAMRPTGIIAGASPPGGSVRTSRACRLL